MGVDELVFGIAVGFVVLEYAEGDGKTAQPVKNVFHYICCVQTALSYGSFLLRLMPLNDYFDGGLTWNASGWDLKYSTATNPPPIISNRAMAMPIIAKMNLSILVRLNEGRLKHLEAFRRP